MANLAETKKTSSVISRDDLKTKLREGIKALELRFYKRAVEYFEQILLIGENPIHPNTSIPRNHLREEEHPIYTEAYIKLAEMYKEGSGVEQNDKKAIDLFIKAISYMYPSTAFNKLLEWGNQAIKQKDYKQAFLIFDELHKSNSLFLERNPDYYDGILIDLAKMYAGQLPIYEESYHKKILGIKFIVFQVKEDRNHAVEILQTASLLGSKKADKLKNKIKDNVCFTLFSR